MCLGSNLRLETAAGGEAFEVTDEHRSFWSFQPIERPQVPDADDGWARQPVDAFVLRKLKAAGLAPSSSAKKRELIRRLYFDVIGLPPGSEEVDAFVADESPGAYERRVDDLLARPQYGERWGRHWLDIVRYAQTNGYERDDEKPNAWRYRDYVIQSLNEDKPYDRFVLEQLAGDELADVTHDSIVATGFYRLGAWDDEPDDKVLAVWEELDDIVQTTAETFLGLTIGCARCHEHKFDPIPQEDYYRLLAFFRNVTPYGKDQSATHWELNPDAALTPLATPRDVVEFEERKARMLENREKLKKRIADFGDPKENAEREKKEGLKNELKQLEKELKVPHVYAFDYALSVREAGPTPPQTHVLIRGSPLAFGQEVQPGFLGVLEKSAPEIPQLHGEVNTFRTVLDRLGVEKTSGRRLALARWIASKDNPLTARVLVNRLWHHHFGRGLVPTPSDFGHTGKKPSHPELLDWLAAELIDGDWRIKRMHRHILTSNTYRQASRATDAKGREVDPTNSLLWRQNFRRLDAEAIRDSILATNGRLNLKGGGRGVFPRLAPEVLATQSVPGKGWGSSSAEEQARRSVYIFIKRTLTVPLMDCLDQATPDKRQPARSATTVAPQALTLLNSSFMEENATAFADRVLREAGGDRGKQIDLAFRLSLGRRALEAEERIALGFFERQEVELVSLEENNAGDSDRLALIALCRMLLNLNEFVYID